MIIGQKLQKRVIVLESKETGIFNLMLKDQIASEPTIQSQESDSGSQQKE